MRGLIAALLLFGAQPALSEDSSPCGTEALYAGMIMHERQYNPENREKIEDDFSNALSMASSPEDQFTVARMRWIFEQAFRENQGLDDQVKDELIADFVTETYRTCKDKQ